jgi:hypothetical protein
MKVQVKYFNLCNRIRNVSPVNLNAVVLEGTVVIANKAPSPCTANTGTYCRTRSTDDWWSTLSNGVPCDLIGRDLLPQPPAAGSPSPTTHSIPKHWTGFSHSPCRGQLQRLGPLYPAELRDGVNLRAQVRSPASSWTGRRGQLESSGEGPCVQPTWETGSTWELRWETLHPAELGDEVRWGAL